MESHKLESVQIGNHILAIYDTKEAKLNDAFEFLKAGLDNSEAVMIITDDMSKDDVRQRMQQEWKVDVAQQEADGTIVIKHTEEWYYPDNKLEANRVAALWAALAELSLIRGKRGLRVFGDTGSFFKHGYGKDLVEYESHLGKRFDIPITALCAYETKDINIDVPSKEANHLKEHHCDIWR
jgi:hypothetical protein